MQSALEWQWMQWTGCYRHYVCACSGFRFLRNHSQFWRLCFTLDWLENEGQHKPGETFACFKGSVKWGLDWNRAANQVKADLCCAHLKESLLPNSELEFPLVTEDTFTFRTVTDWGHGHIPGLAGEPEKQESSPFWLSSDPQNNLLLLSIKCPSL